MGCSGSAVRPDDSDANVSQNERTVIICQGLCGQNGISLDSLDWAGLTGLCGHPGRLRAAQYVGDLCQVPQGEGLAPRGVGLEGGRSNAAPARPVPELLGLHAQRVRGHGRRDQGPPVYAEWGAHQASVTPCCRAPELPQGSPRPVPSRFVPRSVPPRSGSVGAPALACLGSHLLGLPEDRTQ